MATIRINGMTFSGSNVSISGNRVSIDGVDQTPDSKNITITVTGDLESIKADAVEKITINGMVKGNVKTMSGDVECDNIGGDVETMSGDVTAGAIAGKVKTMSGDIRFK